MVLEPELVEELGAADVGREGRVGDDDGLSLIFFGKKEKEEEKDDEEVEHEEREKVKEG